MSLSTLWAKLLRILGTAKATEAAKARAQKRKKRPLQKRRELKIFL